MCMWLSWRSQILEQEKEGLEHVTGIDGYGFYGGEFG